MVDDDSSIRRLWASVIVQALIDATSIPKTPAATVHKRQAQAWLTAEYGTTAQNFDEVCLAADLDPYRVRKFVRNYEGPPLTLHILARMRNSFLKGDSHEDNHGPDTDS
jgi:hypothetical protein